MGSGYEKCGKPQAADGVKRQAKIRGLSSVTLGEKGPDGLTQEQREANRLNLKRAAAENQLHAELCQQEWQAKQDRLKTPRWSGVKPASAEACPCPTSGTPSVKIKPPREKAGGGREDAAPAQV